MRKPSSIFLVPDHFKREKMCINTLEVEPWQLCDVPDYLKTQKICDDVVRMDSYSLLFLSYWYVTQEELGIWHELMIMNA